MDTECKFALIEFGENDKTGYYFIKGGDLECRDRTLARTYWYPDNMSIEDIKCEINDLKEFYDNVAIILPLPDAMKDKVDITNV